MKIYKTMMEAFDDVGVEPLSARYGCVFSKGDSIQAMDSRIKCNRSAELWLRRGLIDGAELQLSIDILSSLESNLSRYSGGYCDLSWIEIHTGIEGVLIGTSQETNFFSKEQIGDLCVGKSIANGTTPSKEGHMHGTDMLLKYSDGLLILPEERKILVSRYHPLLGHERLILERKGIL